MFAAQALLNPVSDSAPAGADLSFSSEFDAIKEARKADDHSLDQGEWITDLKESDWGFVIKSCAALLEQRSKDLGLAVWLAEAGAKKHHLRGLAEGLRVVAGLVDQFWDRGLYPEPDGDDHDQRASNLSWIVTRIPALLREIPVTDGNGSAYSLIDFEIARRNPEGELKLADLDNAKRSTSLAFKATFTADASVLADALAALELACDRRLGQNSPGFAAARDAVQSMVRLMPPPKPVSNPDDPIADDAAGSERTGTAAARSQQGVIGTRAQAIAQLRTVADFFRRTEPHSPVSYFADKAADAGEQDLHAWLRSVIKDPASMGHIEELLGVKRPD